MTANIIPPQGSDWRSVQRCTAEGHPEAHWHRRVHQNGSVHTEFYCPTCDRPVTMDRYHTRGQWVSSEWYAAEVQTQTGQAEDDLPLHRRSIRYHLCYLCGRTAQCEFHHVAPQAIYGKDAERYPVVPLCKSCHDAETKNFTERLERYVVERIRRYLAKRGEAA